VHPMDVQGRNLLAAERFELLRAAAQPSPQPAGHLRERLGRLLITAGLRLEGCGYSKNVSTARIT
jgi:hypothetical protein